MRPSPEKLNAMFDEFNARYFDNKITKVPVVINEKLRATAGRAYSNPYTRSIPVLIGLTQRMRLQTFYHPSKIEISGPIFDHNGWDYRKPGWTMTELEDTLVHEMTHLYLMEYFQDRGHSTHFHNVMTRITGKPGNHRCHSMSRAPKKMPVSRKGSVVGGLKIG